MCTENLKNLAVSLAALLLLAAPAAASAGGEAAGPAMPALLRLEVARSQVAEVAAAYHVDRDGRGANPRHGLELAFTPRGARIDGPAGGFALHLERFGRGDGRPVRRTVPDIDGAWVAYDRGAGLTEWFVNLPAGLEQGWTVARRPVGDGPLVLELDTALPPDEGEDGRLAWSGLVYHRLLAQDAEGRELPASLRHDGSRLRIEVNDGEAVYPVLIDPWVEQAKLTADDGGSNQFLGVSVAVADDTALVGAPGFLEADPTVHGAVYVFTRTGEVWSQVAKLTAADGAAGDSFGASLALAGDTALVGAYTAIVDGNVNQGAAYVFTRSGDTWSQQAKLVADDGAVEDHFGQSVALADDTALVGTPFAQVDGNFWQGAAYVFTRSGDTWSQQAKLTADDGAAFEGFGSAVALAGDTALVGKAVVLGPGTGGAYVFTRGGDTWTQQAKLTADDGARLGASVALVGQTAVVGAPEVDVGGDFAQGGGGDQGAAYVFVGSGDTWSQQARLTAADGATGDQFGASVALAPGTVLVGAPFVAVDGNTNQGAAYVFHLELSFAPVDLAVDPEPAASDGNGVFESGESVDVAPAWRNDGDLATSLAGTASSFTGPAGATYSIDLDAADYGLIEPGATAGCLDIGVCYRLGLNDPVPRPVTHWDATFDETLDDPDGSVTTWTLHVGDSFTDVPRASLFYRSIETLLHHGISGDPSLARLHLPLLGCSESEFCPAAAVTRAEAAVFLLKGLEGGTFDPPACVDGEEVFDDVPFDDPFCPWIEELAMRGVTAGCGGGNYCPYTAVTRAQIAVLLLKTREGPDYVPPACAGVFADVPCPSPFADWIEELFARGFTAGCGGGNYCPNQPITRAQMAAFVTNTFGLTLYGP